MPTIAIADPTVYQNDAGKPTDGQKLIADLNTVFNEVNNKETRIANLESNNMTIGGNKTFTGTNIIGGAWSLNASGSLNIGLASDPGSPANGMIWENTTTNIFKVYLNSLTLPLYNATPTSNLTPGIILPFRWRGSAPPVYASASTFTMAVIQDKDSTGVFDLLNNSTSTLSMATLGAVNGIAQSANLTGTIAYNNGSPTVTGTSTTFSTDYVAGDVMYDQTNSVVVGVVLTVTNNTSITLNANFVGTSKSGANHRRGAKAGNVFYSVYTIGGSGQTAGLLVSVRNVANGATLVDLPTNYTYYRQQPFFIRTDASGNFLPWIVGPGWPWRPQIKYDLAKTRETALNTFTTGTLNVLSGTGTANKTTWTTLGLSAYVPPSSRLVYLVYGSSNMTTDVRETGTTNVSPLGSATASSDYSAIHGPFKCNGSQQIDYATLNNGTAINIDVDGYVVTEVNN